MSPQRLVTKNRWQFEFLLSALFWYGTVLLCFVFVRVMFVLLTCSSWRVMLLLLFEFTLHCFHRGKISLEIHDTVSPNNFFLFCFMSGSLLLPWKCIKFKWQSDLTCDWEWRDLPWTILHPGHILTSSSTTLLENSRPLSDWRILGDPNTQNMSCKVNATSTACFVLWGRRMTNFVKWSW